MEISVWELRIEGRGVTDAGDSILGRRDVGFVAVGSSVGDELSREFGPNLDSRSVRRGMTRKGRESSPEYSGRYPSDLYHVGRALESCGVVYGKGGNVSPNE